MKSPLVKFPCGCVGIPLEQKALTIPGHEDVWMFTHCDAEGPWVSGNLRHLDVEKIRRAVPLTPKEFTEVQQKVLAQLQAGEEMFALQSALEAGARCRKRFWEAEK